MVGTSAAILNYLLIFMVGGMDDRGHNRKKEKVGLFDTS
jgi:hypothetical protein